MSISKTISFRFVCMLLIFLHAGEINSQIRDSLLGVLKKSLPDTEKIKTLNELAVELEDNNSDSAFAIANEALAKSKQINWKCGEALSYHRIGYLHGEKSDLATEIEYYLKAIKIWKSIPKEEQNFTVLNGKAGSLGNLALAYHKTGKLEEAEKYYLESIEIFTSLNLLHNIIGQTSNLGSLYTIQADYPRALKIFRIGLDACRKIKNKKQEASIAGNIGSVYKEQKIFDKAIEYTQMAIQLAKEAKAAQSLAVNTGNLGTIYYLLRKFDLALKYFEESVVLKEQNGNLRGMAGTIANIGNVYKTIGDSLILIGQTEQAKKDYYEKAKPYFEKALKIKIEVGDVEGEGIVKGNYGALCIKTGEYKKAEELLLQSAKIALELNDVIGIIETNERLGELYEKTERYELAIRHYMLFKNTRDSVFNADKRSELTRQELNYEYEKKTSALQYELDKKEALAQAERRKKKIWIAFMIGFSIFILIVSLVIFKNLQKAKKQKKVIEKQKSVVEEKQQEILDSIHYAKRIQQALIPSEKLVYQQLYKVKND